MEMENITDWNTSKVKARKGEQTFMLLQIDVTQQELDEIKKLYDAACEEGLLDIELRISHLKLGSIEVDTVPLIIYDVKKFGFSKLKKDEHLEPRIQFNIKKDKKSEFTAMLG